MKQPVDTAFPAYPWPGEEVIARYGLRRLTAEEQKVFPAGRLDRHLAAASSRPHSSRRYWQENHHLRALFPTGSTGNSKAYAGFWSVSKAKPPGNGRLAKKLCPTSLCSESSREKEKRYAQSPSWDCRCGKPTTACTERLD